MNTPSSKMQPYRQNDNMAIVETKKQVYGLIKAPIPHACKPPGFWSRLFHNITEDTLFRCHCGDVWRWYKAPYATSIKWNRVPIDKWIRAGGSEHK